MLIEEEFIINYKHDLSIRTELVEDDDACQKLSDLCAEVMFMSGAPADVIYRFAEGCREIFPHDAAIKFGDGIYETDPLEMKLAKARQQERYISAIGLFFSHYTQYVIYNTPGVDVRQRDDLYMAASAELPFFPKFL